MNEFIQAIFVILGFVFTDKCIKFVKRVCKSELESKKKPKKIEKDIWTSDESQYKEYEDIK